MPLDQNPQRPLEDRHHHHHHDHFHNPSFHATHEDNYSNRVALEHGDDEDIVVLDEDDHLVCNQLQNSNRQQMMVSDQRDWSPCW